jgi:hypothetical protein
MRLNIFRLWRRGDPVGEAATEESIRKTEEVIKALRKHREENHLGEAFRVAFAARYQGEHRRP